jgi:AraC-like DNA-binding protein
MDKDFASTAMLAILAAGMRRLGLRAPAIALTEARADLSAKRALLTSAVQQGGWSVLPRLGTGIRAIRGQPVHHAMAMSTDAQDLLSRWARLERYIHSRHRIEVHGDGDRHRVRHRSLRADEPPLPHESLVVLGVLCAAIEEVGLGDATACIADVPVYPYADETALSHLAARGLTGEWTLACGPPTATDRAVEPKVPTEDDAQLARRLRQWLLADPMRPCALADAARAAGTSTRSLQRQLAAHGVSYSALVLDARCDAATPHLIRSPLSLAEIGFLSGFADQPHFTRTFRRRSGLTPAGFRAEFAQAA